LGTVALWFSAYETTRNVTRQASFPAIQGGKRKRKRKRKRKKQRKRF